MTQIEVGLQFHLSAHKTVTVPDLLELGSIAQSAGVSQLWVTDNLKERNPFVVLSALAAKLPIKLGTAVMVQYLRNPVDAADALASINEMMEGRELTVGLGHGNPRTPNLIEVVKPRRALKETTQCLRRLLSGGVVTFRDYPTLADYFNIVPDAEFRLEFFTPTTPIALYCGGNGPMSLGVGGAYMDGLIVGPYFQLFAGAGRLPSIFNSFNEAAQVAGRPPPTRRVAELKLSVSRNRDAAREFIRHKAGRMVSTVRRFGYRYSDDELRLLGIEPKTIERLEDAGRDGSTRDVLRGLVTDEMIDAAYVAGDPAFCLERVAELCATARKHGFEQVMFSELGPDANEAVRLLCNYILPALDEGNGRQT